MLKVGYPVVILSLVLSLAAGCSEDPNRPDDLIPEDDYIDLVVELYLINTFSETQLADSISVDSLREVVFEKYEVDSEQFRSSHSYYQDFPEAQKARIDSAIERLRMDEVQDTEADTAGGGNTNASSDTARPPTQPSLR